MRTFAITTLGCKVNQYESQQIREFLEQLGLNGVAAVERPELVVVNTCCVTSIASAKSRACVRKMQRLSPNAAIVVSGCLAGAETDELNTAGENVHLTSPSDLASKLNRIVGNKIPSSNSHKYRLTQSSTINKTRNGRNIKDKNNLLTEPKLGPISSFRGQSRAFLKIQDGCDGYCSYCIIPKIRRNVQSKATAVVLKEAQSLVRSGHKEIVLTGIFLGAYGQNSVRRKYWDASRADQLAELLEQLAQIAGLARIRLSSLEPADVTLRLLETFCKYPKIVPHLHLSLQSGSEAILRKMRRQYTAGEFRNIVREIKSRLDRPAITTDIIVGFPGETENDFQQTIDVAKETGFAKMHIFSFSRRAGTAAVKMQPSVKPEVINNRSGILHQLDKRMQEEFRRQFIGENLSVIIESSEQPRGRCERYFMVNLVGARNVRKGELVWGKLREDGVTADVIKS